MKEQTIDTYFAELEKDIQNAYESGVTIEEAEKLAAKFLGAQIRISNVLANTDLDSRMRKSGVKAIKAAVYMDAATKSEKKPSDVMLNNIVDMNEIVQGEQRSFDEADVLKDKYQNYLNICKEGHVYFRQMSKAQ